MPEFSFIQEITADLLGLEVGVYSAYQNNLHVYLDKPIAKKQFIDCLDKNSTKVVNYKPDWYNSPVTLSSIDIMAVHEYHSGTVTVHNIRKLCKFIVDTSLDTITINDLFEAIANFGLNPYTSKLSMYITLLWWYTNYTAEERKEVIPHNWHSMYIELRHAVLVDRFTFRD